PVLSVALENLRCVLVYVRDRFLGILCVTVDEVRDLQRNVLLPLAQDWHLDGEDVQPVEEIAPKCTRPHGGVQVTIRRRDQPYIDPDRPVSADTLELALLENPQQGELRVRRKIADLVEEDGPAVGELEPAEPPFQRSGERALLVTEELGRDQC